jgi:MFS family permease
MTQERRRFAILALLFVATALNAIDRQTLSVLAPTMRRELHLSEGDYANVVTAFLISYTVMYAVSGRLTDLLGARPVLQWSLGWWSIASMLTGLSRGVASLAAFRCLLGVGEPCVYPAGIKACAEWFPARQRALATGIFSAGGSFGAVAAPPMVAMLALKFGWRSAFVVPGVPGLCWLPFWKRIYRDQARSEVLGTARPSWLALLKQREIWALVLPRLLSDPVWYFYLFWLPDYLQRVRGFSLGRHGGLWLVAVSVCGIRLCHWRGALGLDASAEMRTYSASQSIMAENRRHIPGGMYSLNRQTDPEIVFVRGEGALLWDADDNRYIDYHAAFGPYLLGHNHPEIKAAVERALHDGSSLFGVNTTSLEGRLAELICESVPFADLVCIF